MISFRTLEMGRTPQANNRQKGQFINLSTRCTRRTFLSVAAMGIIAAASETVVPSLALADEGSVCQFDLTLAEKQEATVLLPDGTEATIVAEPVQDKSRSTSLGSGYGSWDIYWYNLTVNSGFTIDVSNYNIIRQHSNWYSTVAMQVNNCELSFSSKYCEQRIYYSDAWGLTSDTRVLWGSISGTTLYSGVK